MPVCVMTGGGDKGIIVSRSKEAKAHGAAIEEVHFHEVGAIDSIVDIIGAAVLIDDLNIKNVIVPYLAEGRGFVRQALNKS